MPIIILSVASSQDIVASGFDAHATAYLTKPITKGDLRAAIIMATRQHERMQELYEQVEHLSKTLEHRKLVERAKGLIMQSRSLTEAEAHHYLQVLARRKQLKLAVVAKAVIDAT